MLSAWCNEYSSDFLCLNEQLQHKHSVFCPSVHPTFSLNLMPASVAQLDVPSDWRPGGRGFNPRRGRQHSFVEMDHEIFSTFILSLPLIQEGQLSVSAKECAQYWLTA